MSTRIPLSIRACTGFAVLAAFLSVLALPAAGQGLTGTIYGKVTDESGLAVPGATVTLTSPQLIQAAEVRITGETGVYRVPNLPPGNYVVRAEMSGFQTITRQDVVLRSGQDIAIDFTLKISQVEETLTVTGESPLVDVKSSQTMRTMETALMENIPLGRGYSDLIVSMPGVIDSEYGFTPAQSVHGSTPRENLFNVDGASNNDTTVGYISTEIPIDMIEEVQVTTGGISAEFGMASGAVFNFVTKSGGNEFHGGGNLYYQGEETEASNLTDELRAVIPAGTSTVKNMEYGGTLGGPIQKDRTWFFGNLRRLVLDQQEPFLPARPRTTNQVHGFIKVTSQLTSKLRVQGSLTTRDSDQFPGNVRSFANANAPENWTLAYQEQRIPNISGTYLISPSTFVDVRFARVFKHFFNEYPNNADFKVGYSDVGTGLQFGGLTGAVEETLKRDQGQFWTKLTHFRENWAGGSHEFKTGFYFEAAPFEQTSRFPNGEDVTLQLRNGVPFRVTFQVQPQEKRALAITRYAAFLEDQWTLGDRLTLNLGVRYEQSEGWFPENISGGGRWFPRDVLEEIRDVINWKTVAPRLGLVWALGDAKRSSIKASYGRYYSPLLNQYLNYVIPRRLGDETYEWIDRNGDRVFQAGEQGQLVSRVAASLNRADPNLKDPYTDTLTIGFEQQFGNNFVVSVTGLYKRDRDIIETVDGGRPFSAYRPINLTNPITGAPLTIFALDPSFLGSASFNFLTTPKDPVELYRNYKGLEIVAHKRMSDGWQFMASLNLSDGFGNVGNSFGSTPGGLALYNNPNTLINIEGPLDLDAPFALKLQGTYLAPYGVVLSGYYLAISGFPLKPPEDFPADPALGAYTLRFLRTQVPQIVVESNIDVAGVPRGSFRHDFRNIVNIRAEKQFKLGGVRRFGLIADVFNLFNSSRVTTIQSLRYDLPQFLRPARIENPLILRIGLRFDF
jgi:outer membrane receptor protein involved in Fe transport